MYDELRAWLPTCDADVLCLQEITRTPGLRGPTRFDDVDRSLPQRANLFEDVEDALPDHTGSFVACDRGPVTAPDGREHRQDFGIAMFTGPAVSVVERATRFVHGSFTDHGVWPNDGRPRIAQAARLRHHATDRHVTVIHLHGLRDPDGKADTPARLAQAHRLAEFVDDVRAPTDVTIVCGDLNVLPDSETFARLGEIGLTDLVGTADTRTSRYTKPVRHADYLLVSHPDAVVSFLARPTPEVSDHRILDLDIALDLAATNGAS